MSDPISEALNISNISVAVEQLEEQFELEVAEPPAITIANKIKSGEWSTKKIDNRQFFCETKPGEYGIDREKRIQVRDQDVDRDFIERQVEKNTPELLDKKVLIFFPSDVYEIDDSVFAREGDLKIIGGNHTSVIEIKSKIFESDSYIVNFDTQLNGKISEVLDLGNLLNVVEKEQRGTSKDDVKQIVMQLMDENEKERGLPDLTAQQIDRIIKSYTFVTTKTIGAWKGHHKDYGGRRKPKITYTDLELSEKWKHYADQEQYTDYIIIDPRSLESWRQTAVSTATAEHLDDKNIDKQGNLIRNQILLIFYCSTQKQADNKEKIKVAMKSLYSKMEKYYGMKIKTEFLKHE